MDSPAAGLSATVALHIIKRTRSSHADARDLKGNDIPWHIILVQPDQTSSMLLFPSFTVHTPMLPAAYSRRVAGAAGDPERHIILRSSESSILRSLVQINSGCSDTINISIITTTVLLQQQRQQRPQQPQRLLHLQKLLLLLLLLLPLLKKQQVRHNRRKPLCLFV